MKISTVFSVLLIVTAIAVAFAIQTNSRASILIKEISYVASGGVAALLAGLFLLFGKPFYRDRIPKVSMVAFSLLLILLFVLFFVGEGSVNAPFSTLMLLSLAVLTVSSLLFLDESHVRIFVAVLVGISTAVFLYAFVQWLGIGVFSWDAALTKTGRSTGTLGNPNLLGGFASAMLPLGLVFLLSLKRYTPTIKAVLAFLFVLLAALAVIASGTRGSLIGVTAGLLFLFIWYIRKTKTSFGKTVLFFFFFLLIVLSVTLPMSSRLSELSLTGEEQGTFQVRRIIWSGAYELFLRKPVAGHGPGSFQILFPTVRDPFYSSLGVSHNTLHAHNEYLEILVDTGILGLLLWGIVFWGVVQRLKNADLLRAGAFAGIVAMLAESFVSVELRWPPTAWLFAMLVMIFLSDNRGKELPAKKIRLVSVLFFCISALLAAGLFVHYIPLSRSSKLVFRGKDYFLGVTEASMNRAYSALQQWETTRNEAALNAAVAQWSNAMVTADSSVSLSRQATEVYPYDTGAWYALGSAYITRYMVEEPSDEAMRSAIENAGLTDSLTGESGRSDLLEGLKAYNSLVALAPNYAEVHNNIALAYINLGMLRESFRELYTAYRLYGHRRDDYFRQVSALLAVCPDSFDAALLYFAHILSGVDLATSEEKLQANHDTVVENAWYLLSAGTENPAELRSGVIALTDSLLPLEHSVVIDEMLENIEDYSPYVSWETGDFFQKSDQEKLNDFHTMMAVSVYTGYRFPTAMPDEAVFYRYPDSILFNSGWNAQVFDAVLHNYLYQIVIDRKLDDTYKILCNEKFSHAINPEVARQINAVRMAVGGSRAALREGLNAPWIPGSLPDVLSDSLHAKMAGDSLNVDLYAMELKMTFLLVSSYWWEQGIFASAQNQYLLERIFYCRDKIREIEPLAWSGIVSRIVSDVLTMEETFTDGRCPPEVSVLMDDLVRGVGRFEVP